MSMVEVRSGFFVNRPDFCAALDNWNIFGAFIRLY